MIRRALILAGLSVATWSRPATAASDLKVVYIGGWDCPPCAQWKNTEKAHWLASAEYRRVTWIEVESPRLKEAYQELYWPDDLKPVLARLPRKSGTPRFLIVKDGRVVANEFGTHGWAPIMADLKKLLGE